MCEYCGCQALDSIALLTAEHDAVVNLMSDVRAARQAGDLGALAAAARAIASVLAPHTVVEEEGLFPAMAAEFPDHVARLRGEHRVVEAALGAAVAAGPGAAPSDPDWPEQLSEAMHLLREHILAEQDGVFPAALSVLDGDAWDVVDAVRARAGTAVDLTASGLAAG
ncbi:MAG: hemerythrin domain-containing protein [Kineosporiaceae bacterium]